MPFVAKHPDTDEWVIPAKAEDSVEYICTNCAGKMFVRPHTTTKSSITRHFYHYADSDCFGETDVHFHAKMMASSLLVEIYQDLCDHSEYSVDDEMIFKKEGLKNQFADAGVKFNSKKDPWGAGIAVEIQHKNKSKKRGTSTYNYNQKDVSVLWIKPHQLFEMGDDAKNQFYRMILGKHKSLKSSKRYPYIVFHDEVVNSEVQKDKSQLHKKQKSKNLRNESWSADRWRFRAKKKDYKSLTPEPEPWHCGKHGCLNHFIKIFEYERDEMVLKMKRCEVHGEPTDAELTTAFGGLRRESRL